MKKSIRIILALVIAAALAGGGWSYANRARGGEVVLYGNVDQRQIELAFIDAERIAEVLVEEGMTVAEGQILARLETRRLRDKIATLEADVATAEAALTRLRNGTRPEEIDQARAAVVSAEAEAAYASQQFNRYQGIWTKSKGVAVSIGDVDEWRSRHVAAQAGLVEAKKALVLAEIGPRWEDIAEAEATLLSRQKSLLEMKNRLDDAELKSPAASVVRARLLEPGDMASPQRPVLSLAVLSPKWVRAYVAETDLGRVKPGQAANVFIDSYPDKAVAGTVGFISSVAEFTPKTVQTPDLRTALVYEIRVYVQDADNILRLGMPATVTFPEPGPASGSGS
ncbi:efflux RND transporter periplasmic adaptor subunit [Desulfovibrio sp. OttesenSCG-928-O18]|nr:efflux RND transporter periplasmic adaptor subunit [Desulfovibrio sp. OttesenSCG-928-O18]